MKKLLMMAVLFTGLVAAAKPMPNEVGEKVLKAFKETFTIAQDVTWQEYEDYYQANFRQEDIQIRAQYDEEGRLLKTIRYYTERQLLPNIVARLKSKYSGRSIEGVTETTSDDEVSFVVTLKDNTDWYVVKSDVYGNLQLMQKFKRADN